MTKPGIGEFLAYFEPHAAPLKGKAAMDPPPEQWGYSWGARGQIATEEILRAQAKLFDPKAPDAYFERTKRWLGRPIFDCNGLAEAFYALKTGEKLDSTAKGNYKSWCTKKSAAAADEKLPALPQMPGVALFRGENSARIGHVGFLLCRYGDGPLDWHVLECKGADYGLVISKLCEGKWTHWGLMEKLFDYGAEEPAPLGTLRVRGGSVHLRPEPSTEKLPLATVHEGDEFPFLGSVPGWHRLLWKGKAVYISAKYAAPVKVAGDA
ncbi:MAG: hypothetical protein LBD02_04440 [Christensenellaceae bacterium]|jgi:hypothetical protein|nr:hypothetical protein [Christensenellaceae bacterium]